MKLVCMFTHSSTPNHTMSMPILCATGPSSGRMMKAISKKSRKNARKNTNTLTASRKPTWPPGRLDSMCSTQTAPSTPWKTSEKTREPIRMKTTIAVSRMVPCMASHSIGHDRRRWINASTSAPTAPIAPASVGVAMAWSMKGRPPIEPSTAKIKIAEGMMPRRHLPHSAQPCKVRALAGRPGTFCG